MARTGPLYCRLTWPSFCPVFENTPVMPFLPGAWTSFPMEPENGITGLPIRGRIRRIWDTVFPGGRSRLPDHSQDRRKVPLIRALFGPGSLLRTPVFRDFVQKQAHFYTLFQESPDNPDLGQTGHFTRTYKTLLYAFGRQISGLAGFQHVAKKRRAVLGVENHHCFSRDIVGDSPHGRTWEGEALIG